MVRPGRIRLSVQADFISGSGLLPGRRYADYLPEIKIVISTNPRAARCCFVTVGSTLLLLNEVDRLNVSAMIDVGTR